ncbi:hypothetical protein M406DRAFT_248387 [Cryphonectria parasitica EP155]|uniref:Uncharacterized protein n=1 Tax=Cryphonectria parasitica (strain ATCC 38755 / EP155) TaxID=660469 RepID=A0A9P4YAI2_CRYP1|nr:uncharacterized protein M406DRAFT_248387 [Cryphonectria parasitica EP155]KAF3769942.1 hypothetical protein M406DRAFT_248387 [Cryphonectria parasitica EP155]
MSTASPYCLPSPDGRLVATLLASTINIREIQTLHTVKDVSLPRDFSGTVTSFQWSPSSRLVLVAAANEIHVFSACDGDDEFSAAIKNPAPPAASLVCVTFGALDTDVCVCASLGLMFAIYNLASSSVVEVANPKFHTAASVRKGFCFRPRTRHLAVLTRTSGKDVISFHHPETKELQRSWCPDTLDAQGVVWSPDGKWLVAWESAAHGHKVLFYTPDGNLFKAWSGPQVLESADADIKLGAGTKLLGFSADARSLAIGDSSRRVCILDMTAVTERARLQHPKTIVPTGTLQLWQEHVGPDSHQFIRALQAVDPPIPQHKTSGPSPSGCALLSFDASSTLLATRLEDSPSTVWIWDVAAAELRAVLLFHRAVLRVLWHPVIRETLLIACDDDACNSPVFLWDPLSEGPKPVDLSGRLSNGKLYATWLDLNHNKPGALFISDSKGYLLASLADQETESVPWCAEGELSDELDTTQDFDAHDEASPLDDTFCFKKR